MFNYTGITVPVAIVTRRERSSDEHLASHESLQRLRVDLCELLGFGYSAALSRRLDPDLWPGRWDPIVQRAALEGAGPETHPLFLARRQRFPMESHLLGQPDQQRLDEQTAEHFESSARSTAFCPLPWAPGHPRSGYRRAGS